ncbi:MAG: helix-turn-helix domain-containing protein [Pleomorphochaeta sp.]
MIDFDNILLTAPKIKEEIALNFKRRRKENKVTQKQLAKETGVSLGSIKRFEQTGEISLSFLILLSQRLNLEKELYNLFTTPHYENIEDMLK